MLVEGIQYHQYPIANCCCTILSGLRGMVSNLPSKIDPSPIRTHEKTATCSNHSLAHWLPTQSRLTKGPLEFLLRSKNLQHHLSLHTLCNLPGTSNYSSSNSNNTQQHATICSSSNNNNSNNNNNNTNNTSSSSSSTIISPFPPSMKYLLRNPALVISSFVFGAQKKQAGNRRFPPGFTSLKRGTTSSLFSSSSLDLFAGKDGTMGQDGTCQATSYRE